MVINRKVRRNKPLARNRSKNTDSQLRKLETEVKQILKKENKLISEEKKIEKKGDLELNELKKLEDIERKLKSTETMILRKITYHDFVKSAIGAFAGVVGSFAFAFAPDFFLEISSLRAHMLLLFSFVMVVVFVYFSGFRKVKEVRNLRFFPLRILVIYFTALATVVFVLSIFGFIENYTFIQIYKLVSATSILAVLGACAADMIGGE